MQLSDENLSDLTNLTLPRMLVLAAMAKLRGMELPTTERIGAGATSVVNQAGSVL